MRFRLRCALIVSTLVGSCGLAQPVVAAEVTYAGTMGQQHVTLSLDVDGNAVRSGHYSYDAQRSDIRIVDSRVFGTTVVLQDEDGNILHLHFQDAHGAGVAGWKAAESLGGTLSRGDLDLPVNLSRAASAKTAP